MDSNSLSPPTTRWLNAVADGQENMPPVAAESIAVDVAREDVRKRRAAPDVLERQECKRFRRVFRAVREADASASGSNTLPASSAEIKALSAELREILKTVAENVKKDFNGLKKDVNDLKKDVNGLKKDVNGLKKDVNDLKKDVNDLKKDGKDVKAMIGEIYKTEEDLAQDIQTIKKAMSTMAEGLATVHS
jgi:archaellum component FlaC